MKKLLTVVLMCIGSMAYAGPHHNFGHGHHRHFHQRHSDWVAPLIIGGVIGYAMTRPAEAATPPVIVQQPVIINSSDIVYINGVAYRKDRAFVNGVWQEVLIRM